MPPLVVILGPTGSGKSALAMAVAQRFGGEIIAADSRTIYKGMDIATAKPSSQDRQQIPHHLLDITTPDKPLTAADFKKRAIEAIDDVARRGKLPILVGGTGLYIDSVIYDFQFWPKPDRALRDELQQLSVTELQSRLQQRGIALPDNSKNPRHLIRALETGGALPRRSQLRPNTLLLGLMPDWRGLRARISQRVDAMVAEGLEQELRTLAAAYGWNVPALQTPGYKAFKLYIVGNISLEAAKKAFVRGDLQYAKRQRTWFKRNNSIHWLSTEDKIAESVVLITTLLNK